MGSTIKDDATPCTHIIAVLQFPDKHKMYVMVCLEYPT